MIATLSGAGRRVAASIVILTSGMLTSAAYASMATGGLTSQPIGHFEFCKTRMAECLIRMRDEGPAVMTAALWFRVFLRELHGIEPRDISWIVGRTHDLSHGGLLNVQMRRPVGVSLTWLTAAQTFDIMLDSGEIDAAYGFAPRHDPKLYSLNIDRFGGTRLEGNPRLGKLFSDGGCAVVKSFYNKTRVVPANHVIVAQRRSLEQNPWLAGELLQLFSASKEIAYERSGFGVPDYLYFAGMDRSEQAALFGEDPFPFGIAKNRAMLEMLFRGSHEQGLTQNLARIEEVFYPALLDT